MSGHKNVFLKNFNDINRLINGIIRLFNGWGLAGALVGGWLEEGAGGPGAPAGPQATDSPSNAIN